MKVAQKAKAQTAAALEPQKHTKPAGSQGSSSSSNAVVKLEAKQAAADANAEAHAKREALEARAEHERTLSAEAARSVAQPASSGTALLAHIAELEDIKARCQELEAALSAERQKVRALEQERGARGVDSKESVSPRSAAPSIVSEESL
eukprot:gnl/TRDRNA2_/TRDRNA2_152192_c2_seq1.p1 gnl/TRDRNA2_/TRDRNA2_152192_c2~~gnl/TRDRNA2_/TRDRNA2_152192_c2_seq1.p1  ORF type:complete len:165 (-),score=46.36 gnl/TRDRNA2_/TRDRNA2_152192_c2_seq1:176-622(-)